jgi:hypothetical protein
MGNYLTQTKEHRDAVRGGVLLPELYGRLEEIYRRHGLPGLVIGIHNLEVSHLAELSELDQQVVKDAAVGRLLLAFQIQRDGHAADLAEALDIASDHERIRVLYPEAFR